MNELTREADTHGDQDPYFGRMAEPTVTATIKGICGDEMEFCLVIRDDRIEEVRYRTEGCGNTRSCGHAVARRAKGRMLTDALSISAGGSSVRANAGRAQDDTAPFSPSPRSIGPSPSICWRIECWQ